MRDVAQIAPALALALVLMSLDDAPVERREASPVLAGRLAHELTRGQLPASPRLRVLGVLTRSGVLAPCRGASCASYVCERPRVEREGVRCKLIHKTD